MRAINLGAGVVALLLISSSFLHSAALAGPIHDAAKTGNSQEVERLIAAGIDPDERDIADKTALHWAADRGQVDVVKLLVAEGADVNARDFSGVAVLALATVGGHEAVVKLLISKGADVNYSSSDGSSSDGITPLDDATRKGYPGIIELLKNHGAKCGTNVVYSC
jgi:ankyrin repeat protein